MTNNTSSRHALELNGGLLGSGAVLLCVGGVLWLAGAGLAAVAVAQAVRKWVAQLDESPAETAHKRIQQFKVAASAGSKAWREQPH